MNDTTLELFKNINKDTSISDIVNNLDNGIKQIFKSDKFIDYLNFISSFYKYSYNNIFLILMQNPDATLIGSYTFWKSKNRHVKSGEHGLKILAPTTSKRTYKIELKDKDGKALLDQNNEPLTKLEERKVISGFKWTTVFDVSQTDGDPIPKLLSNLESNNDKSKILTDIIKSISQYPIEFRDINFNGYFSKKENQIIVRNGLSADQTAKTLIHEYVHSILHDKITDYATNRSFYEMQAEGTAYVVMKHYGIDTSQYSFSYVGSWVSDMDNNKYKEALQIIQNTSKLIIENIDDEYEKVLIKHRENELLKDLKVNDIKPNKMLVQNIIKLEDSINKKVVVNQLINGEILKLNCEHEQLINDIVKLIKVNTLVMEL